MRTLHRLRTVLTVLAAIGVAASQAAIAQAPAAPAAPASVAAAPAGTASAPPAAEVRTVTDTYFGTAVPDPYRWLENTEDKAVQAWMRAQADHARATLDSIPGRAQLLERVRMYDDAVAARVINLRRRPGDLYFYEKRGQADSQFKLYVRRGIDGAERLLFDPELLAKKTGKPHAINYFEPSSHGRYVAIGISAAGSEDAELSVLEVATGRTIMGPIQRAQYGGVAWLPDDSGFFFIRLQEMKPGMPVIEKFQRTRAVYVGLRGDADKAPIAMIHTSKGVDFSPAGDSPYVFPIPGTQLAGGAVYHGTDRELSFYVAPLEAARTGAATWRKVFDRKDAVTGFEVIGDRLFVLTHRGAPRFRVLETSLKNPNLATAKEVLPQQAGVITGMTRAADGLYFTIRAGAATQLHRMRLTPAPVLQPVELPFAGSVDVSGVDHRIPGVMATLMSWTRGAQIYRIENSRAQPTALQPAGPYDALPDYESREVLVKSHDGAMVPLSIIHKKGLVLDGSNPTLLYGYASYGITEEPWFSAWRLAWLERGGVFAVANPRGSGAFGQDWYKAGFQETKPNTWKDFIACAEYLVAQKITNPARLGIWGGSAGGILVGRAMTERPDLFAAVIPAVGVLDAVRAELTPNGVPNIPEFGTHKTESGFRALLAMSTYHQVRDGVKYPGVLLTHGVNDPRVEVWHSTKGGARLQAASTSGRPVLISLDFNAGHGIGDTKEQRQRERADVLAFLLWQFGVEGFQPARK